MRTRAADFFDDSENYGKSSQVATIFGHSTAENAKPQPKAGTRVNGPLIQGLEFGVTLLPEDALRFKQLTTTNISRHVMLAVGDVPMAAPRVLAPIENGRFVIPCETKEEVQTLEKVLQGLAGGR